MATRVGNYDYDYNPGHKRQTIKRERMMSYLDMQQRITDALDDEVDRLVFEECREYDRAEVAES